MFLSLTGLASCYRVRNMQWSINWRTEGKKGLYGTGNGYLTLLVHKYSYGQYCTHTTLRILMFGGRQDLHLKAPTSPDLVNSTANTRSMLGDFSGLWSSLKLNYKSSRVKSFHSLAVTISIQNWKKCTPAVSKLEQLLPSKSPKISITDMH